MENNNRTPQMDMRFYPFCLDFGRPVYANNLENLLSILINYPITSIEVRAAAKIFRALKARNVTYIRDLRDGEVCTRILNRVTDTMIDCKIIREEKGELFLSNELPDRFRNLADLMEYHIGSVKDLSKR